MERIYALMIDKRFHQKFYGKPYTDSKAGGGQFAVRFNMTDEQLNYLYSRFGVGFLIAHMYPEHIDDDHAYTYNELYNLFT
jgi:hypothetical protein